MTWDSVLISPLSSGSSTPEGGRVLPSSQRVSKSLIKRVAAYVDYVNRCMLFVLRAEPLGGPEMHHTRTLNGDLSLPERLRVAVWAPVAQGELLASS